MGVIDDLHVMWFAAPTHPFASASHVNRPPRHCRDSGFHIKTVHSITSPRSNYVKSGARTHDKASLTPHDESLNVRFCAAGVFLKVEGTMNFNDLSVHIGNGLFAGQVVDLYGGLFLLLVGAAILRTLASWRFCGLQVDGEIIGVRHRGPHFHGVYRYVLPSGEYCEATAVQSCDSLQGLQTGRRVPIQVMTNKLDEAREPHAPTLWALAIGLLLNGAWLIHIGATISKRSPIAWVAIVLAIAFVAHRLWRRMRTLFAKMQSAAVPDHWSSLPIKPAESLGAMPSLTHTPISTHSKSRRAGVVFVTLGLGVFALDYWQTRGLLELRHGIRTSGIVTQLSKGATGRNADTFLFPVVQYIGQDGLVRFHDRIGARPSPFKVGDTVQVVYLPGEPATARIDRGLSNWGPLGALAAMGTMLTGLGLFVLCAGC
jgi:Protein of unknown function (DUF3592)